MSNKMFIKHKIPDIMQKNYYKIFTKIYTFLSIMKKWNRNVKKQNSAVLFERS